MARSLGYPSVEVVGESYNLKSIAKAIRGKPGEHFVRATLVREPKNKHDSNAVRVDIDGRPGGHIPKEEAPHYHGLLAAAERAGCSVEANCRVWYDTEYGDRASISLDMVEPAFAWPVNPMVQSAQVSVWPEGRRLKVSPDTDHSEGVRQILAVAYEPGACAAYLRITIPEDGSSKLVADFNGVPVGLLSPAASKQIRAVVEAANRTGRHVYALSEIKGNSLAAEIKILIAPAEELTEEQIRALTG